MRPLPRFFILAGLAGTLLWLADGPYPLVPLAKFIVVASVAGFFVSAAYVHTFMPSEWRAKRAALRRLWRSMVEILPAR